MDKTELKALYEKLFQYCYSRLSDRDRAEDAVQETFLRFLEHPEYQGSGKEQQYLYTIARNLCIYAYRRRPHEELAEDVIDESAQDPSHPDRMLLRAILDGLPEDERELIVLRYVSGLSVREIASISGVSWFAMNRRIRRILGKMREQFGKEESV